MSVDHLVWTDELYTASPHSGRGNSVVVVVVVVICALDWERGDDCSGGLDWPLTDL